MQYGHSPYVLSIILPTRWLTLVATAPTPQSTTTGASTATPAAQQTPAPAPAPKDETKEAVKEAVKEVAKEAKVCAQTPPLPAPYCVGPGYVRASQSA
jgi:hypothetical protein